MLVDNTILHDTTLDFTRHSTLIAEGNEMKIFCSVAMNVTFFGVFIIVKFCFILQHLIFFNLWFYPVAKVVPIIYKNK